MNTHKFKVALLRTQLLLNRLLTHLVRSSLIYLTAIFNRMQSSLKLKKSAIAFMSKKQTNGSVYKIVIITHLLLTLACWFNRLCKEYSKDKMLYYAAGISNIKKAKARQTFDTNDFK